VIKTGANPTVSANKIFRNRGNGLYIFEEGLGVIEGNDIFDNESSGVVIRSQGHPQVCTVAYVASRYESLPMSA
jgi:F-box protein 11